MHTLGKSTDIYMTLRLLYVHVDPGSSGQLSDTSCSDMEVRLAYSR